MEGVINNTETLIKVATVPENLRGRSQTKTKTKTMHDKGPVAKMHHPAN